MTYFKQNSYRIYDSLPCGAVVFLINEKFDIVYSNAVYNALFDSRYIKVSDEDISVFSSIVADADTPKTVCFKSKDARGKTLNVRAFVVKISAEEAFALIIDDSENIETIKDLDQKCARYAAAIRGTNETFYEYNKEKDTVTIFFSDKDGSITTHEFTDFFANIGSHNIIFKEDLPIIQQLEDDVKTEKCFDVRMRIREDCDYEWYTIIAKPDSREGMFVGSARNIQEEKTEEERLREKVLIDPLSKVYNRAAAVEKIEKYLKTRLDDCECALIVLDIDNFKTINDTYGHLYGDAVIAMAAGSIKSTLDEDDVIGRFGGDEFFVFIDNAEREYLEKKLEDIRLSILKMRLDQNDDNDISCSIGVAIGKGGDEYEELFRQADSALYSAKKNGKNRFEYFDGNYSGEEALSYAGVQDEDESNEAHNIVALTIEIASKATTGEAAISNILRHIGMAMELDCIQILKYDTIEDKIYLEFQWWRETGGAYNVIFSDTKVGYYSHNDLMLFKNRFAKDKIFQYTPDFKEGFSQKYVDVFEKSEHLNILYASSNINENSFFAISYQCNDKDRQWTEAEFNDLFEVTKILSMYSKTTFEMTEREKALMHNLDYDWTGLYTMEKFFNEAGRIGRDARSNNEVIGIISLDVKDLYGFNITYGRDAGDTIIHAVVDALKKIDPSKSIACRIGHTDQFTVLFRTSNETGITEIIENSLAQICAPFDKYTKHPVILKTGLCFFKPGEYIINAIDAAANAKKGVVFDKCRCIVAKEPVSQYTNLETVDGES